MFLFDMIGWWDSFLDYISIIMIISGIALGLIQHYFSKLVPIIYKLPAALLAIALFTGGVYLKGYEDRVSSEKEQNNIVKQTIIKQKVVTKEVVKWLVKEQEKQDDKHEKIAKEITTKDDHMCVVPQSFVRVHNAGAENVVPDTATRIDGAPSGVEISTVEKTVIDNYDTYHKIANQLKAWQKWAKEQKKANP